MTQAAINELRAKGLINSLAKLPEKPTEVLRAFEPCRYFCDGPDGYFWCDDLELARRIVNAYDKDEDWTITDVENAVAVCKTCEGTGVVENSYIQGDDSAWWTKEDCPDCESWSTQGGGAR